MVVNKMSNVYGSSSFSTASKCMRQCVSYVLVDSFSKKAHEVAIRRSSFGQVNGFIRVPFDDVSTVKPGRSHGDRMFMSCIIVYHEGDLVVVGVQGHLVSTTVM